MRKYTSYDLLRFKRFAEKNTDLKPMELIRFYNAKYPELSEKQKLINVAKGLGMNDLYKKLTGKDLPPEDRIENWPDE